jgi:AmiR/NasT family two-component response regulator
MTRLADLIGWRAVILHRLDEGIERMVRQLGLLGLTVQVQWAALDFGQMPVDVVFIDADHGWSGLLPWLNGPAPVPVIALLQSEAPGRVAWALDCGASAILSKPVVASAIYPALVLAASVHRARTESAARITLLEERVRLRPLVHGAVRAIMAMHHLDEDAAYRCLRIAAMGRRVTMEQSAAEILAGVIPLPEAG